MKKCMGLYCPQLKTYVSQPKLGSPSTSSVLSVRSFLSLSFTVPKKWLIWAYVLVWILISGYGFISHVESLHISSLCHCGMTSKMFCSQVTFTTNYHKCFIDTFTSHILPAGLHHAGYFLIHLPTFIQMFGPSVFPSFHYMWMLFFLRCPSSCNAIACALGWRLSRRHTCLHWMARTNSLEQQGALIKTGTVTGQMILPWVPSSGNNQGFALIKAVASQAVWLDLGCSA